MLDASRIYQKQKTKGQSPNSKRAFWIVQLWECSFFFYVALGNFRRPLSQRTREINRRHVPWRFNPTPCHI
jgi:hypothetical protein